MSSFFLFLFSFFFSFFFFFFFFWGGGVVLLLEDNQLKNDSSYLVQKPNMIEILYLSLLPASLAKI